MPLRDRAALHEWGRREDPPYSTWEAVNLWVDGLASAPWQAPSTPFPELSDLPNYEVRVAEVPNSDGVEVFIGENLGLSSWISSGSDGSRVRDRSNVCSQAEAVVCQLHPGQLLKLSNSARIPTGPTGGGGPSDSAESRSSPLPPVLPSSSL